MKNKKYFRMPETIADIMQILESHTTNEEERFSDIHSELRLIKENHLAHIEKKTTALEIQGAVITTDLGWVKKGVLGIIGGIGAIFISLLGGAIILAYSLK